MADDITIRLTRSEALHVGYEMGVVKRSGLPVGRVLMKEWKSAADKLRAALQTPEQGERDG